MKVTDRPARTGSGLSVKAGSKPNKRKRRIAVSVRLSDHLKHHAAALPSEGATVPTPPPDPIAALFSGVKALRGVPRVPNASGQRREQGGAGPGKKPIRFIVERDGAYVEGYRDDPGAQALARLKRSAWLPQDTLDLHGLRAGRLADTLGELIAQRARHSVTRLLIIHGKGLHSLRGAGVLGNLVVETLTEGPARTFVRAFRTASPRLGGEGALAVELGLPRAKADD